MYIEGSICPRCRSIVPDDEEEVTNLERTDAMICDACASHIEDKPTLEFNLVNERAVDLCEVCAKLPCNQVIKMIMSRSTKELVTAYINSSSKG